MNIKLLRPTAKLPVRATDGSAGYDLTAAIDAPVEVYPNNAAKITTGIAVQIPTGYCGLVFARSSLGTKYGIVPANCVGVIDSDYRGEITVMLTCHRIDKYVIFPGDRIAQLVIVPILTPELKIVENLDETERGAGGFGSTGK